MRILIPRPICRILARRDQIISTLRQDCPGRWRVISNVAEMKSYESDGLIGYCQTPMVGLPRMIKQVSRFLHYCYQNGIKVLPCSCGFSLSGDELSLADGVLFCLDKFKDLSEIDFENRVVVLEPGGLLCRLLLRTRSVVADCLFDRRQGCRISRRRSDGLHHQNYRAYPTKAGDGARTDHLVSRASNPPANTWPM